MLKGAVHYLKKSLLFFDIKSRNIPMLTFLLLLAVNSVLSLYQEDVGSSLESSARVITTVICCSFASEIISLIYMVGAAKSIRGEETKGSACVHDVISRLLSLLGTMTIKWLIVIAGFMLSVTPLFFYMRDSFAVVYSGYSEGVSISGLMLFLFAALFIFMILAFIIHTLFYFVEAALLLEPGTSVLQSFRANNRIMKGRRAKVFLISIYCGLAVNGFGFIFISLFSGFSPIVVLYIIIFVSSLIALINMKRLAHMYTDIVGSIGDESEDQEPGTSDQENSTS